MAGKRDLWRDAEALDFLGRQHRHFGNVFRAWIVVDEGVRHEQRAALRDQQTEASEGLHAFLLADDLVHVTQVPSNRPSRPQINASASPRLTERRPMTVLFVRMICGLLRIDAGATTSAK